MVRPQRIVRALAVAALVSAPAGAQQLTVKRALSPESTLPCPAPNGSVAATRNDSPDVRRLVALGHEAAIVGDHRQARDVFADAARLSPGDERIAYQLGRAYEELGERPNAVREYCRFLALAPQGSDAPDVRSRITALSGESGSSAPAGQALVSFRVGVGHLDQRRWPAAVDAFTRVVQALPRAAEAFYDRGLALALLDQRDAARRDLEQYLTLRPGAQDAAAVRAQIDALRRPAWNTTTALVTGLVIPGLGQAYTSRPWFGLGVAALAGTSLYFAMRSEDREETHVYSLPPGFDPPTYTQVDTVTKHPYYLAGLAAFSTLTIGAAFEAARYARRSHEPPISIASPAPAARVGAIELSVPSVIPTRRGLALLLGGTVTLGREHR